MILLESKLDECGLNFYVCGKVYKVRDLTLCKIIQLLQKVSGIKLNEFSSYLGLSPQQFSYKIRHRLSVAEIYKLSQLLELNDTQIVNLFLRH